MISRALTFLLIIATCAWAGPTRRPSAYAAWKYARPCSVKVEIASLMRYVVVPRASGDTMQADYDDIRFADDNGVVLYHWLKDTVADTARFWLGLDTVYANSRVWCYSGNASATSGSDIALAFERKDSIYWGSGADYSKVYDVNLSLADDTVDLIADEYSVGGLLQMGTDGKLYCVYRHADSVKHSYYPLSQCLFKVSDDSGATWGAPDTVLDLDSIDERPMAFVSFGSGGTDTFCVFIFRDTAGAAYANEPTYRAISYDHGATWDTARINPTDTAFQGHSQIASCSDGSFMAVLHKWPGSIGSVLKSNDRCATWSRVGTLTCPTVGGGGETTIIETGPTGQRDVTTGWLRIFGRTINENDYWTATSKDLAGTTWVNTRNLPDFQSPGNDVPCVQRVANGAVIATYGNQYGLVYKSVDECSTWTRPAGYWGTTGANAFGRSYTSWVEIDSNRIVMLYNQNGDRATSGMWLRRFQHSPWFKWHSSNTAVRPEYQDGFIYTAGTASAHIYSSTSFNGYVVPLICEIYSKMYACHYHGLQNGTTKCIGVEDNGTRTAYIYNDDNFKLNNTTIPRSRWFNTRITWTTDTVIVDTNYAVAIAKGNSDTNGVPNYTMKVFGYSGAGERDSIDWAFVRAYTDTVPTVTLGAYGASMTLDSISPATGTASGGDTVRWYGTGFTPTTGGLTLAGVAVTVVAWTDTLVTTVSGAGTAGTGDAVLTDAGSNTATIASGWTYSGAGTTTSIYHWLFGWMRGWFGR